MGAARITHHPSLITSQFERLREPVCNNGRDPVLASIVEVIAIGDDLDPARSACPTLKFLGGVAVAVFLVAPDAQNRALDPRPGGEDVGKRGEGIEKALRGDHVPPPRNEHELAPTAGVDERASLCSKLVLPISGKEILRSAGYRSHAAAAGGKQYQSRRLRMVDDVTHPQHAAVAVPDYDRVPKSTR